MPNNVAHDNNDNLIHSNEIYSLRNSSNRLQAREKRYHCPHCETEMKYAQAGSEGCFRHIPSTPKNIKENCPYYYGLLAGCTPEEARAIEEKKQMVQSFLQDNNISGFTVISYFSEPYLVRYIERFPDMDFIIVGNKLTQYERDSLDGNHLILKKKAIAKYLSSTRKTIIQTFAGTNIDKIYLMKYVREYGSEVVLKPYLLLVDNLKTKKFVDLTRIMRRGDIVEIRTTRGKHDNRVLPEWMR